MTKKPDGGPAFPFSHDVFPSVTGMTLRDWFAGQALAGALWKGMPTMEQAEVIADCAYRVADAMISEGEK